SLASWAGVRPESRTPLAEHRPSARHPRPVNVRVEGGGVIRLDVGLGEIVQAGGAYDVETTSHSLPGAACGLPGVLGAAATRASHRGVAGHARAVQFEAARGDEDPAAEAVPGWRDERGPPIVYEHRTPTPLGEVPGDADASQRRRSAAHVQPAAGAVPAQPAL